MIEALRTSAVNSRLTNHEPDEKESLEVVRMKLLSRAQHCLSFPTAQETILFLVEVLECGIHLATHPLTHLPSMGGTMLTISLSLSLPPHPATPHPP